MPRGSLLQEIRSFDLLQATGRLRSSKGMLLSCTLPAAVGDQCEVLACSDRKRSYLGEVIGFSGDQAYLVLYEQGEIHPGMEVVRLGHGRTLLVGDGLLGRVVDGLGRPLDERGPLTHCAPRLLQGQAPAA